MSATTADEKQVHSTISRDLTVTFGHNSQQGPRPTMEDAVVLNDNYIVKDSNCTSPNLALFVVFDGHGGGLCSEYCGANIGKLLAKYLTSCNNVHEAIARAVQELDDYVVKNIEDGSGSTCTLCLIDKTNYDVWVANIGDSRCILISKSHVEQLSIEHKPDNPNEKTRIEQADGWVTSGRVMGILAVSRSIGDKGLKCERENLLVSTPSIIHHKITENDAYIVLACDGLFDVYKNEEVPALISNIAKSNPNLSLNELAKQVVTEALTVRRSKDNVSTIIVDLHINEPHPNGSKIPSSSSSQQPMEISPQTGSKRNIEVLLSPHRRTGSDTSGLSSADNFELDEQKAESNGRRNVGNNDMNVNEEMQVDQSNQQ